MHYYQFHIGDYRAATAHLSNEEDLAYRRLLDMYYDTEKPLSDDVQWIARRIRIEPAIVSIVLNDMFQHTNNGWVHERCEQEIQQYQAFTEKRSLAGKASAERRKNTRSTPVQQVFNNLDASVQLTTNQEPLTINQEPIYKEPTVLVPSPKVERTPAAPISEIVDLFNAKLPQLPRCEVVNDARKRTISARWREVVAEQKFTKDQGLEWFGNFFDHVRGSKFLTGKVKDWKADIDFIFTPTKFARIVEGAYHKD